MRDEVRKRERELQDQVGRFGFGGSGVQGIKQFSGIRLLFDGSDRVSSKVSRTEEEVLQGG